MENPIKMDGLGGNPPIFGNTHMLQQLVGNGISLSTEGPAMPIAVCGDPLEMSWQRAAGFEEGRRLMVKF